MHLATPPIYGWFLGFTSKRVDQTTRAEIQECQQEIKELSRWLDSGACTPDDESSLKEAIVYIKGQIRDMSRV